MKTCPQTFTATLFIIAKKEKQFRQPPTNEWINNLWFILTMEYHLAIKRNKILTHIKTWMSL